MDDATGLGLAYKLPYNNYMHNKMLFMSGTHSIHGAVVNLITPIGKSRNTHRYDHSITMLDKHTNIDTIVGHPLGDTI